MRRKINFKKIALVVILLIIIAAVVTGTCIYRGFKKHIKEYTIGNQITFEEYFKTVLWAGKNKVKIIEPTDEMIYEGDLILVNKNNKLNEKRNLNLINLDEVNKEKLFTVHESNIFIEKDTLQNFTKMLKEASNQGVKGIEILSSYRSLEAQQEVYNEYLEMYKKQGYKQEAAINKTNERVAAVGCSEHHTGMCIDMGLSNQLKYGQSNQSKWFSEHMYEFGFIERFKEDKKEITGVMYEPWHIRYVGLPHAQIIKDNNWCFEEYIDYLKQNKSIDYDLNGAKYKIEYKPQNENWVLDKNTEFVISRR